jgi:hypothetical protein
MIEKRELYDVNKVMQDDLKLIEALKAVCDKEENPIAKKTLKQIESRFIDLTSRAHTRGHWTGSE